MKEAEIHGNKRWELWCLRAMDYMHRKSFESGERKFPAGFSPRWSGFDVDRLLWYQRYLMRRYPHIRELSERYDDMREWLVEQTE